MHRPLSVSLLGDPFDFVDNVDLGCFIDSNHKISLGVGYNCLKIIIWASFLHFTVVYVGFSEIGQHE